MHLSEEKPAAIKLNCIECCRPASRDLFCQNCK
jgi:hypothetical protein